MKLNKIERKKAFKEALGSVYIFMSKFSSNSSNVLGLLEMYWGKPFVTDIGILGNVFYWKVESKKSTDFKGFLRIQISDVPDTKISEIMVTKLTKKEMYDGDSESRYYFTKFGGELQNSQKYLVRNFDDALDFFIDISEFYRTA